MSINYTTLFARLGRIVKWANLFIGYQGTNILGAAPGGVLYDTMGQFTSRLDLVPNFVQTATGWANTIAGWVAQEKAVMDSVLGDLQSSLNAPSPQPAVILPLLFAQMVVDSQTIKANGSITSTPAAGTNTGNGLILTSIKNVLGNTDERILPEVVIAKCTSDKYSGGTAGAETFSITGVPKPSSVNSSATLGNGNGPTLTVADSLSLLANGNFATFTVANTPDSWTIDAGVVGTTIFQESTNVHTGTSALKLAGNGVATTVTLHQTINTLIQSSTIYFSSVWLRKAGTVTAGSTFKVQVTGTGFGPFVLFNADPSTLTTSYVNYPLFWPTGVTFPADAQVQITWTAANTAGATAVVDVADVVLAKPVTFGNVQYAAVRGSTDFAKGDVYTVTNANNQAGVFQTAFGRFYNFQLPSSGSPTIADSLAV